MRFGWDNDFDVHPAAVPAFEIDVHDVTNAASWSPSRPAATRTLDLLPLPPAYSAEFFDGQRYVLKGASPAREHERLRPSFRNWFRPHYPYVYVSFRCARSLP